MIYLVIPIYNEAQNIPNLAKELNDLKFEDAITFVFSDDGSKDDSIEKLETFFADRSKVILGDGNNYGPGNAFNVAFEWVCENSKNENDVVVTLEADCTSDLSILKDMLVINQLGYDLVLASVYAQGGGFDQTNFVRKLISSLANLMFRFFFDIKILTISSFYRVYNVRLLHEIQKNHKVIIREHGFICMLEILLKAIKCNAKIIEVPMTLYSTKRIGKSNMKVVKTMVHYLKFLVTYSRK